MTSLFEAFLSESTDRSIAAAKTIVDEFLTDHSVSVYPITEAMSAIPTNG